MGKQWKQWQTLFFGRVTAGPKRPHLGVCPGPTIPLQGKQASRGCIPGFPGVHGKQILYHLSHQGNPLHICPWLYKCLDDTVLSWGHQKMGHFWKQVTFNGSLWRWEGTERKVGVTGVAPGRWYVWRSVCLYFFL